MQVSRRQFFKICAGGMAGTTAAALGFAPSVALAETRQYKLLRTRETRNTCTYCSVGCGLLMYSLGDGAKNAKASIFHIEGDWQPESEAIAEQNLFEPIVRVRTHGSGTGFCTQRSTRGNPAV